VDVLASLLLVVDEEALGSLELGPLLHTDYFLLPCLLSVIHETIPQFACRHLWSLRKHLEFQQKALTIYQRDVKPLMQFQNPPRGGDTKTDTDTDDANISRCLSSSRVALLQNFVNVQTLDLGCHGEDHFLFLLSDNHHQLLPQLQRISMKRSLGVTDVGLEHLSRHNQGGNGGLQEIDITYCRKTTYAGTFPLRQRLAKSLKLLRRQPEWLDGQFYTPFGDAAEGHQVEIHTYWPDGSFSFNRNSQSNGFVCDLFEWNPDNNNDHRQVEVEDTTIFVGDKLQYNNFTAPLGWPEWTRYCYRPGVSLLKLPDHISTDNKSGERIRIQSVLVSQHLRGLTPPNARPLLERAQSLVALGTSKYFDKHTGHLLADDSPFEQREDGIMISKMRLFPLPKRENGSLLPPKELVEACRVTCEGMREFGTSFLALKEEELHTLLTQDLV
jgi:hypothetical protein